MLILISIYLLAVGISFIAAIPVGAVNMAVVQATLNEGKKPAYLIGLGAILVEAVYCAIPLFSLSFLAEKNNTYLDLIFLISIPVLIIFGLLTIINRKASVIRSARSQKRTNAGGKVLYGFTLCVTNPMILIFWGQITGAMTSLGVLTREMPRLISFLVGVPCGTFLLYALLVFLVSKRRKNLSLRVRAKINLVVGWIFIFLAGYLLFHFLRMKDFF